MELAAPTLGAPVGLAGWTLVEYLAHRFEMHRRGPVRFDAIATEHRRHHADPLATDIRLRMAGHAGSAGVGALIAVGLARVIPAGLAAGIGAGLAAGYSTYELVHWTSHHRPARTRYGRWVRRQHQLHHYGAPARNYGVTNPVWDLVFGTTAGEPPHSAGRRRTRVATETGSVKPRTIRRPAGTKS